jgi:hypothetical protein
MPQIYRRQAHWPAEIAAIPAAPDGKHQAHLRVAQLGFLPLLHRLVEERAGERRLVKRNPSPYPSPRYAGRGDGLFLLCKSSAKK